VSAHAKTSGEGIRAVARKLLEREGIERLSMQAVADAVGVRAPSLYKRFSSRGDLLNAITADALRELQCSLEKAVRPGFPYRSLRRMAAAYRAFAKNNPHAYSLFFDESPPSPNGDPLLEGRLAPAAALFQILSEAIGDEKALLAARTLVAFLHGFVSMELGNAFHFGGDINTAFRFGLAAILDALLASDNKTRRHSRDR
jgi:AcrR family transcriptional regulator